MESSWITTESIPNEWCLYKKRDVETHRGSDAGMEAEI